MNNQELTSESKVTEQMSRLETLGSLASGIAHEINTPLQYISSNLSYVIDQINLLLAKNSDLDSEVLEALKESSDGVKHISHIVRAMKSFAHPGSAEDTLLKLPEILEDVRMLTKNEWKDVAECGLDIARNLPCIMGSQGAICQIFINLIVNAAQAIEEKNAVTREMGLILLTAYEENNQVVLTVQDSGSGIPEEIQHKIFQPFFTTKTVGVGSGQGLSVVQKLVQAHNGSISFESKPKEGTTFIVRFPAV